MKIESYIVMPKKTIEEKLLSYSHSLFSSHPEICYAKITDKEIVTKLVEEDYLDPRYMNICISISVDNKVLMGYDINGLNLWDDILDSIENLLETGESEVLLGIEPIFLSIKNSNNGQVEWKIQDEFSPHKVYYFEEIDKTELVNGLISGAIDYFSTLLTYNFKDPGEFENSLNNFKNLQNNI